MNEIGLIPGSDERIGLFGGTFNPIHKGHVRAAQEVLKRFGLDCIFFVPSALPPHKADTNLASSRDRYAMVEIGLQGLEGLAASDVEIHRAGPSYSVDTVAFFRKQLGPDGQLFFLLGVDAFLEIDTWKRYEAVLENTAFIVMTRPPLAHSETDLYALVAPYIAATFSQAYVFDDKHSAWIHPSRPPIFLAVVPPVDIASSQLRRKIEYNEPTDPWL